MLTTCSNYWHTLKHLKLSQILNRLYFLFYSPKVALDNFPVINPINRTWQEPIYRDESITGHSTFSFLNVDLELNFPQDWKEIKSSKLWTYNLHYFNDLNCRQALKKKEIHQSLIISWINNNPLGCGIGWDSYPTSIRIVNWIKWLIKTEDLDEAIIKSLVIQTRWLSKRIEYHLSANHLLANAKTLIFSGLFFHGEESNYWLKKGMSIYKKEISSQILKDGGHYERSPMYHAIILEDILDILNASIYWPEKIEDALYDDLALKVDDMMKWLEAMVHPDGEVSFFNDSSFNIAPKLEELSFYAQRLGFRKTQEFKTITRLDQSGYFVVNNNHMHLIMDIAPLAPNHQAGHGHADTLSFELSLFGERLIVNTGVSTYDPNLRREFERSTKAHNTVEINNSSSSGVWNSFRVARKAIPLLISCKENINEFQIKGTHNGYHQHTGSPQHFREWVIGKNKLVINDKISGSFKTAIARLYLHPAVKVEDNRHLILPSGKMCKFQSFSNHIRIKKTMWSPEFGCLKPNNCIEIEFDDHKVNIEFSW